MGIQRLELKPRMKTYLLSVVVAGLGVAMIYFSSFLVKAECSPSRQWFCDLLNNFDPMMQEYFWMGIGGLMIGYCAFEFLRVSRLPFILALGSDGVRVGWNAEELIGWAEVKSLSMGPAGVVIELRDIREIVSFFCVRKPRDKLIVPLVSSRAFLDDEPQRGSAKRAIKQWISNLRDVQRAAIPKV